jgi:hypothetical protein
MHQIKEPIIEYLGNNNGAHLIKIIFPVIEKSASKFDFVLENNESNVDNIIYHYGVIVRLKPENLFIVHKDSECVQVEIMPAKHHNDAIKASELQQLKNNINNVLNEYYFEPENPPRNSTAFAVKTLIDQIKQLIH